MEGHALEDRRLRLVRIDASPLLYVGDCEDSRVVTGGEDAVDNARPRIDRGVRATEGGAGVVVGESEAAGGRIGRARFGDEGQSDPRDVCPK